MPRSAASVIAACHANAGALRCSISRDFAVEIEQTIADAQPVESKRGRPGPSDARLRELVDVYRRAARSTHYAIAETGRQMNLSRASVQRWLDLAHVRELFPEGRVGAQTITRED